MSSRGLLTRSIKTIKNTNNFSIFNWIPWSSHGMTEVKLIHATTPSRESGNDIRTTPMLVRNDDSGIPRKNFLISRPFLSLIVNVKYSSFPLVFYYLVSIIILIVGNKYIKL
ncbi:hypothetical protein [Rickettsia asembonensis]|uniref:hypothetical protein n=1 Tax=Rickettsia asembonensis TaxID=1068590 RepID=UPI0023FA1455|nr:hypothetical protein [Rickettsia asembonensis]